MTSSEKIGTAHVLIARVKANMATTFIINPVVAISGILRIPVEKTMAFGGVATGNIKANEQATAVEIMRYRGFSPNVTANSAIIGINNVAVALLLVTSVAPATIKQIMRFITHTFM